MRPLKLSLLVVALTFQSCAAPAVGAFIKAVAIEYAGRKIAEKLDENITLQQLESYLDGFFARFFNVALNENSHELDISPLKNNPLLGRMRTNPKFIIEGSHSPNTLIKEAKIEVNKSEILYQRMTEYSAWELTTESAIEVQKRIDIGALQLALTSLGYECKVDGKKGPITERAVKKYQRNYGLRDTGDFDPQTRSGLMMESN